MLQKINTPTDPEPSWVDKLLQYVLLCITILGLIVIVAGSYKLAKEIDVCNQKLVDCIERVDAAQTNLEEFHKEASESLDQIRKDMEETQRTLTETIETLKQLSDAIDQRTPE